MSKRFPTLLLCAAVVFSAAAFAQAPPPARQTDAAAPTEAAQSTPPASTTLRLRGTVDKYEAATRILSLSTLNGTVRFPLAAAVRIRQDSQQIDASELQKLAGYRAAVRYSESGGNRTVESVHVFGKAKG
jgi:hypothetical protein